MSLFSPFGFMQQNAIPITPIPLIIDVYVFPNPLYRFTLAYVSGGTYTGIIDWGDGTTSSNSYANRNHNYSSSGYYTITINGIVNGFNSKLIANPGNAGRLLSINQFGNQFSFGSDIGGYFYGCQYLTNLASDIPLNGVTNMSEMFKNCYSFNQNISSWNVSGVTNMSVMFQGSSTFARTPFNQNISSWNVSNVTNMSGMFSLSSFNQNIGSWNVSNVTNMLAMFSGNISFNQNIGSWNVSNVTRMDNMFYGATSFNQNIGSWNVSNVYEFSDMFNGATSFNQNINSWTLTNAYLMSRMFANTTYNQNIGSWNVSNVLYFSSMFQNNTSFNQNISSWNVGGANTFAGMFDGATSFNQDISSWNVGGAIYLDYMFRGATSFNQNIGNWNVSNTQYMDNMLSGATSFTTTNLDNIYNGWSTLSTLKTGVNFRAVPCYSSSASAGRAILTGTYGWVITDGGLCSTPTPTPTSTPTVTPTNTVTPTPTPTPTPVYELYTADRYTCDTPSGPCTYVETLQIANPTVLNTGKFYLDSINGYIFNIVGGPISGPYLYTNMGGLGTNNCSSLCSI